MRHLHRTVVQLEEAKRFILADDVPHLRLALILLDNAVEVIMHRAAEEELRHAQFYARLLERLPSGPLDEEGERLRSEFQTNVIPEARAKKIRRFFGEKVTLLSVDRQLISTSAARVLRHIHDYRNETQHQDRVRPGSLRPACLILLDIACDMLVTLRPGSTAWDSDGDYSWLPAYGLPGTILAGGEDVAERVAEGLRSDLALDQEALRAALVEHLHERLTEMEEQLAFVVENSTLGPEIAVVLKAIQFRHSGPGRDITDRGSAFDAFVLRYAEDAFTRWRDEIRTCAAIVDRFQLFDRFATIEDDFEPLEATIKKTARDLDAAIELAVDIARGK